MELMGFITASGTGSTTILDSSVLDFIVDGATDIIGILTTPPLGVFLTIGIVGAVVGLVAKIVRTVRQG